MPRAVKIHSRPKPCCCLPLPVWLQGSKGLGGSYPAAPLGLGGLGMEGILDAAGAGAAAAAAAVAAFHAQVGSLC